MTTKVELIEQIAEKTGVSKAETSRMLEALSAVITASLKRGEAVSLTGIGSLSVKYRSPRLARNPRTGEAVSVKFSKSARFCPSSNLKKALNPEF